MSEQVAKDRNGKEIRVGDRVRSLVTTGYSGRGSLTQGEVHVVERVQSPEGYPWVYVARWPGFSFDAKSFELAEEETELERTRCCRLGFVARSGEQSETELQRLVRTANEGLRAFKTIADKYDDQVNHRDLPGTLGSSMFRTSKVVKSISRIDLGPHMEAIFNGRGELFVEKKPTFTPFKVGKGWEVKLSEDGKTLTIGCRKYEAKVVRSAFQELTSERAFVYEHNPKLKFHASRNGVYENQEFISWADAEKILKSLEDSGV
jgi:hypothetical protein